MAIQVNSIEQAVDEIRGGSDIVVLKSPFVATVDDIIDSFRSNGLLVAIEEGNLGGTIEHGSFVIRRTEVVNADGSIPGELVFEELTDPEKAQLTEEFAAEYGTASFLLITNLRMEQLNPRRPWQPGVESAISRLPRIKQVAARKLVREILQKAHLDTGSL